MRLLLDSGPAHVLVGKPFLALDVDQRYLAWYRRQLAEGVGTDLAGKIVLEQHDRLLARFHEDPIQVGPIGDGDEVVLRIAGCAHRGAFVHGSPLPKITRSVACAAGAARSDCLSTPRASRYLDRGHRRLRIVSS